MQGFSKPCALLELVAHRAQKRTGKQPRPGGGAARPAGPPQVAPYGHGGGSQGIAAGPRVHPDPPPHPTGPGRPAPSQVHQAQGEHSHPECCIPAPRLPAKPWPACDPAVAAAEEGAERGAKGALGGPLGVLGYTYHRHISINWCAPARRHTACAA